MSEEREYARIRGKAMGERRRMREECERRAGIVKEEEGL